MAFSLDDIIAKATDALNKSAADHDKKAEQAEALADLINDRQVRDLVDDLALRGTLLVGTVGSRLKDIFHEDKPAEEPEPQPEPAPEPQKAEEKRPEDVTFEDIFGAQDEAFAKLIDAIRKAQGARGTRIVPDDEQGFGQPRFPFGL